MISIYVDEAGTDKLSPFRIVSGFLVEEGDRLEKMEHELKCVYDLFVPRKIRESFKFHATDIINGKGPFKEYQCPLQDRLDLLKAVVCLPYAFDAPIVVGAVNSKKFDVIEKIRAQNRKMDRHEIQHALAFALCVERADRYISMGRAKKGTLGEVISEDHPTMKFHLTEAFRLFKMVGFPFPSKSLQQSKFMNIGGFIPNDYIMRIKSIRSNPRFVKKGVLPMLDIADALAYSFRRWLCSGKFGEDLIYAMLGEDYARNIVRDPAWTKSPGSFVLIDHVGIRAINFAEYLKENTDYFPVEIRNKFPDGAEFVRAGDIMKRRSRINESNRRG